MDAFKEGDMVWVKWKNLWWPSKVLAKSSYPSDLELPKDYLAVVQYIGEDDVEVICDAHNIHHYNGEKKEDFLRRGIRTDNTKFRQLFSERIKIAEELIHGDPDILSKINLKRIHSCLFGSPSDSKSKRVKKEDRKMKQETVTKVMSKKKKGSPQVTRLITHPRFISDKDDHTVRILADCGEQAGKETPSTEQYRCHQCDFSTSRLNNLLSHNQTHSASPKKAYVVPIPEEVVGRVLKYGKKNSSTSSPPKKRRVPKDKHPPNNGGAKRSLFDKVDKTCNKTSQSKAEVKKKKLPKYTKEKDHILQQQLLDDWNEEDFSEEEREVQRMQEMLRNKDDKSRNCEEDFALLLESTRAPDIPDVPRIKASFCCTNESSSDEEYEGEMSSLENESIASDGKVFRSEPGRSRNNGSDFVRGRSFNKVLTSSDIEADSDEPGFRTPSPSLVRSPKHVHSPRVPQPSSDCDKRFDSIMAPAESAYSDTETAFSTIVPPVSIIVPPSSTVVPPSSTIVPPSSTIVPPSSNVVPPSSTIVPPASTIVPPASTIVPPSSTVVPPSLTIVPPSSTIVPPSSTIVPPSSTLVPPSSTIVPACSTSVPPSSTIVPPLSTIVPPSFETAHTVRRAYSAVIETTAPPNPAEVCPASSDHFQSDFTAEGAISSRVILQDAFKDAPNRPHVYANVPLSPVNCKEQLESPGVSEASDTALSAGGETSQGENGDCVVITINSLNELDQVDLGADGGSAGPDPSSDKFGGERDLLAAAVATSDLLETQVPVVTSTNNTLEVLDKPDSSGFVIIQLGGKAYKVELSALAQVINSGQT